MKKILLGTSALVAAGVISSAAHASEPVKLEVGGYMDWWVAAVDQSNEFEDVTTTQYNNVDVFGNGEVHFKGSTTLDNGVKVGVQVELEGGNRSESDPVDESYVTVDSQYGRLVIGSDDNVAYSMHVSAPDVGRLGLEESYLTETDGMTGIPAAIVSYIPVSTSLSSDNDAQKITYITPTFSGLTFGASYIPGDSDADLGGNGEDTSLAAVGSDEGYALGLTYSADLQGAGVTVSAGYASYDLGGVTTESQDEYSIGVNVAVDAFTFGGAYRDLSNIEGTNDYDGQAWNVGVAWEQGPYGASVAYMNAKANDSATTEDEVSTVLVSGRYNMGAGVDAFASFGYVEYDAQEAAAGSDNKAAVVATGIALTF